MRNERFEQEASRVLGMDIEDVRECYHEPSGRYSHWNNCSLEYFWAGWMAALGFSVPPIS